MGHNVHIHLQRSVVMTIRLIESVKENSVCQFFLGNSVCQLCHGEQRSGASSPDWTVWRLQAAGPRTTQRNSFAGFGSWIVWSCLAGRTANTIHRPGRYIARRRPSFANLRFLLTRYKDFARHCLRMLSPCLSDHIRSQVLPTSLVLLSLVFSPFCHDSLACRSKGCFFWFFIFPVFSLLAIPLAS